mgnify:CR=1 FL=1
MGASCNNQVVLPGLNLLMVHDLCLSLHQIAGVDLAFQNLHYGAWAPYGYRKDPDNCHKLLIDEDTAPVVRQIFEWAHEHVALNRIVRNLNEMGITAPSPPLPHGCW